MHNARLSAIGVSLLFVGLAVGCGGTSRPVAPVHCDEAGCYSCADTTCPYICDELYPCPTGYTCTAGEDEFGGLCVQTDPAAGREVVCDEDGCLVCRTTDRRECETYVCDPATAPCPTGFTCDDLGRCEPEAAEPCLAGECCAHSDCAEGFLCSAAFVCVPAPTRPECDTERPCPAGATCEGGVCVVPPECVADADCPSLHRCDAGECVPRELPHRPDASCLFDIDCGPEGRCINAVCYFPCGDGDTCPVTEECLAGWCYERQTPAAECITGADCGDAGARCVDALCRPLCETDAECGLHERCDAVVALCVPDGRPIVQCVNRADCAAGRSCVEGRCLTSCRAPNECDAGETCDLGFCMPVATCATAADCPDTGLCINATCDEL